MTSRNHRTVSHICFLLFMFHTVTAFCQETKQPQILKHERADPAVPVLGDLPLAKQVQYLRLIHDVADAQRIESKGVRPAAPEAWQYTEHQFGYIPKANLQSTAPVDITDAGAIQADSSLKGAVVIVTLDRLRVFKYPGSGEHSVLFDFHAEHQPDSGDSQDLKFSQTYRVLDGSAAGITGFPVFVNLKVPTTGLAFSGFTVNVSNTSDKNALAFMDSPEFTKGLQMLGTVNPLVPVVSGFATGLVKMFLTRNENKKVQDFYMGLDFSGIATRAQLKEGSYIVVQVPPGPWDWSKYQFVPTNGRFELKSQQGQPLPFNYVVFSVSKIQ